MSHLHEETYWEMLDRFAKEAGDMKLPPHKRISKAVASGKFKTVKEISKVTNTSERFVKAVCDKLSN